MMTGKTKVSGRLVAAFNKPGPPRLTPEQIVRIRDIRSRLPLKWYCKYRFEWMEFDGSKAKCPGKNHDPETRLDPDHENEFVVWEDSNTWTCMAGNKCKPPKDRGDHFDLEKEHFYPDDPEGAIQSLEQITEIYEQENGPWCHTDKTVIETPKKRHSKPVKTIHRDEALLAQIIAKETEVDSVEELSELSPYNLYEVDDLLLASVVHTSLFRPFERRCIGKRIQDWEPLIVDEDELRAHDETLLDYTFMTGSVYQVKSRYWKGEGTPRQAVNVDKRVLICVEIDERPIFEQLKVICHLADKLPLCVVCESGNGRSLHAWYNCRHQDVGYIERFKIEAKQLYADGHTLGRNAWGRLPNGLRWADKNDKELPKEEWKLQQIVYFDPEACQ